MERYKCTLNKVLILQKKKRKEKKIPMLKTPMMSAIWNLTIFAKTS